MSAGTLSLKEALAEFVRACNANPRLRQMNQDWSRTVAVDALGSGESYWLRSDAGELSTGAGAVDAPDLWIGADDALLIGIFSGRVSPVEPYNAGDLRVRGRQEDILRLDVISLLIWGE